MENELQHHGVLGMRWGVRRYQNKDGSLTPRGQKRYKAEMDKVKAETKKIQNQQRTAAKLSKLDAAKKNLAELKKGKKSTKDDDVETDEQKRERILKNPNPKDVYENKHLFSNKEVGDLFLRLNNEENIRRLVPKEVDAGKEKTDRVFDKIGDMTTKAITLSKAYNAAASIINAFNGTDSVSLPKIDIDNINKGNKVTRGQEKKNIKKAQKEAEEAQKAAEEAKKATKKEAKAEKTKNDPEQKTSDNPRADGRKVVDAFISKVQDKPVSEVSSSMSRKQIENMIDRGDFDFNIRGQHDRSWDRWDDD